MRPPRQTASHQTTSVARAAWHSQTCHRRALARPSPSLKARRRARGRSSRPAQQAPQNHRIRQRRRAELSWSRQASGHQRVRGRRSRRRRRAPASRKMVRRTGMARRWPRAEPRLQLRMLAAAAEPESVATRARQQKAWSVSARWIQCRARQGSTLGGIMGSLIGKSRRRSARSRARGVPGEAATLSPQAPEDIMCTRHTGEELAGRHVGGCTVAGSGART